MESNRVATSLSHIGLLLVVITTTNAFHNTFDHSELVLEVDKSKIPYVATSKEQIFQFPEKYQADQNLCPYKTICSTLSECRLLLDLMDRSCLIPSKLKELTCGYRHNEPMVCCPVGGHSSPWGNSDQEGLKDRNRSESGNSGLNGNCGRPQLNGWQSGYSGLGSQPWVVRVGFKNSDTGGLDYPCCGTIITRHVILTAAHCALAVSAVHSLTSVRVGEYDMRNNPDCTNSFCAHPVQNIPVSHVVVHPGYERKTFRHDVALLILKSPMNYSLGVQPICLLHNDKVELEGKRVKLVGWGKLPGQDSVPLEAQQLDLPVVELSICSKIFSKVLPITSNQLCVGGEARKDACSGFGGAPLVVLDHVMKDRYYQVGMVSFGSDKCGAVGVPSVYTSVHHYYEWIKNNIPS